MPACKVFCRFFGALLHFWQSVASLCGFHSPTSDISFSVILPFSPPSHSLLPPMHVPLSLFSLFHSQINLSHFVQNWFRHLLSLTQSPLTASSSPILLHLLLFFSSSISLSIYPTLHSTLAHYKWGSFALYSYLVTSAELWNNVLIECGWHLSILCCRIGAMHKILCWQPAVHYHHSTDIQYWEDRLSISQDWLCQSILMHCIFF